ncbi:NADP-dependent oxidoreductase [Streptomyces sp. NBC_00236]|uniref:NADP-dependent oxidoreductase n=1 Tax=unclassified Streptomyces TaxID=2593676 RepID=UPI002E2D731F|nr:NADP-dependent oxidoreductase [Streptomyces sp. NBC_00236]
MSRNGRIAVARRFGPPTVIAIEEHPSPPLGRRQVRVAVRTGGLNPVDARRRAGTFGGSVPMVLGTEFAGVVVESDDPEWQPGDEVIGWGAQGADADLVTTDGTLLHTKPADLDWALAGGLSGVGQSALTALDAVSLTPGDVLVVHGAAGGVGTVLTQLAHARGLTVIGTASTPNHEHLRLLGAIPVAYGPGLAGRILAAADGHPVAASIDLAGSKEAGEIAVSVAAAGGQAVTLVPETMASHGIRLVQTRRSRAQLSTLLDGIAAGTLKLPVKALPFTEIVEAHQRLDAQHARGKLVLDLSDNPHLPDFDKDA